MKKLRVALLALVLFLGSFGTVQADPQNVYVIEIRGEISNAMATHVKEKIEEAKWSSADVILFDIDTYGGRIDAAEEIKNAIIRAELPTVSYVNNKAESAGVLITLAGEKVYMNESATIGSAETIPNTEKVLSMWRGMLRDVAQLRGRDEAVVEGMADQSTVIEGVKAQGELINLTSREAVDLGIADATATNLEDCIRQIGGAEARTTMSEKSFKLQVAEFLSNNYVSTVLLIMGLVGMIVEIFVPGFGIGGVISILGFGLFFAGNILSGESHLTPLILFVLGFVLLGVEVVVPGFGLPGISGLILVFAGIVMSMGNFQEGVVSVSIAIIVAAIVGFILVKKGFSSTLFDSVVLNAKSDVKKPVEIRTTEEDYLGKTGTTITVLRPSGTIEVEGNRLDALTDGEFIEKGADIIVSKVVGSKIFVRRS